MLNVLNTMRISIIPFCTLGVYMFAIEFVSLLVAMLYIHTARKSPVFVSGVVPVLACSTFVCNKFSAAG